MTQHTPNNNDLPKSSLHLKFNHPSHRAFWVFGWLVAWAAIMLSRTTADWPAVNIFWLINLIFASIFAIIHAVLTVKRVDTWPTRAAVWSPNNFHLPAVLKNNTISRTTAKRSFIFSVIQLLLVCGFFCANIFVAWGVDPHRAVNYDDEVMPFRSWIIVGVVGWTMTLLVASAEASDDKDRFFAIKKYVDEGETAFQLAHNELHNMPHTAAQPVVYGYTSPAAAQPQQQYQQPQQQNTYGSTTTTYGGYQNL